MALKQTFANSMLNSIPTDFETNVGQCYANRLYMALKQNIANSMLNRIPNDFETNIVGGMLIVFIWLKSKLLPTLC